jgi:hypothetical protein
MVGSNIACFPANRRHAQVRRCAGNLDRVHGEAASRYWRIEMRSFADSLKNHGQSDAEISKQVLLFTGAVMEELQRTHAERTAAP